MGLDCFLSSADWVCGVGIRLEMLGGMNLITTVIGFGMSATFIVFVCTRLICGRLRGVESRQMFEIDSRIDLEQVFFSSSYWVFLSFVTNSELLIWVDSDQY